MDWNAFLTTIIAPGGVVVSAILVWREIRATRKENDKQHQTAAIERAQQELRLALKLEELGTDVNEVKADIKEIKHDIMEHVRMPHWFHNK